MLTNTSKFIKGNKNKHTIVKVLMKCQSQIQNPNVNFLRSCRLVPHLMVFGHDKVRIAYQDINKLKCSIDFLYLETIRNKFEWPTLLVYVIMSKLLKSWSRDVNCQIKSHLTTIFHTCTANTAWKQTPQSLEDLSLDYSKHSPREI